MPCNPIHKQIKRSRSGCVFVRAREYAWEFMKIIIKAQERKTVCCMRQSLFSLECRGFPACGYIGGTWKESEMKHYILYCKIKNELIYGILQLTASVSCLILIRRQLTVPGQAPD